MKKGILLIVLSLIIGLFTGCSTNTASPNNNDAGSTSEPGNTAQDQVTETKNLTVGIVQFGEHGSLENCRTGFIKGLEEEGFIEGENLTILYENAQFDTGMSNQISQSFVAKKVDLIAAIATPVAQSAFNAAKDTDIPVVFTAVTDPIAAQLDSGNVTGTSDKLPVEAQLKMIREMMPEAKNIGILFTTSEVNSLSAIEEYKSLADGYGFNIVDMGISAQSDVPLAVDRLLPQVDAISNLTDNTVVGALPVILSKANEKNIPVFGSEIEQVKLGCVAAEGLEYVQLGIQTGKMAAKILKGEETADNMEFEIIAESSLYINSEALESLGIKVPDTLTERAVDVLAQ